MQEDTTIAGLKTVKDWKLLRTRLISNPTEIDWEYAYDTFLLERINTRYFEPIYAISQITKNYGKGFSIVAIYCSLIEFFQTLKNGYDYIYPNYYDKDGNIVRLSVNSDLSAPILRNKGIFISFLSQNLPFSQEFTSLLAESFYNNVRCSILHQAQTTGNWKIKKGKELGPIIEQTNEEIILNWKAIMNGFAIYLKNYYRQDLLGSEDTQKNFIFKWDKICNISD